MNVKHLFSLALLCLVHQFLNAQIYGEFTQLEGETTGIASHISTANNGDYFTKFNSRLNRVTAEGTTLWTFPEGLVYYSKVLEQADGEITLYYLANISSAAGNILVKAQLSAAGDLLSSIESQWVNFNQASGLRVDPHGNSYFLNKAGTVLTKLDSQLNTVWDLAITEINEDAVNSNFARPGFFLSDDGQIDVFGMWISEQSGGPMGPNEPVDPADPDELLRFQIDSSTGELISSNLVIAEHGMASVQMREDGHFSIFVMDQLGRSLDSKVIDFEADGSILQETEFVIDR